MDTKPEGTTPLEESALLRILAGRAGTEIERQQAEEALQESEEQYRNLVESTHDLIQSVAPDGRFLFVNQAWSNTLGYTKADLAQRTLFDIIHPDSQAHCQAMFARVIAGESLTNLAATFVTKDGRAIPVEGNVAARYSGGTLVATHGFFRDITERKQAEKALHTRERQQAVVAELGQRALAGEDLTALMDQAVAEVAQTLDAAYCKVIELLPEGKAFVLRSGVGWHDGLVGTGIVGAELDSQAGYTLVSSEPVIVEDLGTETRFHGPPLLHAHGVVSGISVIIAGQPHPFCVLGVHTTAQRTFTQDDVHFLQAVANVLAEAIERKQAEEQVRRNEAWQRSLLQATQDAFISINRQGHITRFNPAAERIFGYTQAEVQGQKVNLLMPELYAQDHDSHNVPAKRGAWRL
jgi:PAS domain S-box-containing protein